MSEPQKCFAPPIRRVGDVAREVGAPNDIDLEKL
jgi:hypothetical protein